MVEVDEKRALYQAFTEQPRLVVDFMKERKDRLTALLVSSDNEQVRGRIKELNDLLNMSDTLQRELTQMQQTESSFLS